MTVWSSPSPAVLAMLRSVYSRFDAWAAMNDPQGEWDLLERIDAYRSGYERASDCCVFGEDPT
jgi:hypothetical protein